jgi:type IX secretion system PorP/SprF family membrane protein
MFYFFNLNPEKKFVIWRKITFQMKSRLIFFLLVSCVAKTFFAQQEPLMTLFWQNYSRINPAMTGVSHTHLGTVNWRNQWDGVNGAPNTLITGYQTRQDKIKGGVGFNFSHDAIGFSRINAFDVNYSHHLVLKEKHKLYLGISAGLHQYRFKPVWGGFNPPNDPIFSNGTKDLAFVTNLGLAYSYDKFLVGISSTKLNQPRLKNTNFTMTRNYFVHASYTIPIKNVLELKPQLLVRSDLQSMSTDVNLLATFKKHYWIGFTYRTSDAYCGMIGVDFKGKYRVSYAYDRTYNALSTISKGSHEIGLAFMLE